MCGHQVDPYVRLVDRNDETNEPAPRYPVADHVAAQHYEIRVRGHLGSRWSSWFDGMTLTCEDDGSSVIRGFVVDQAALHGLLNQLRDLGITLISLTPLAPGTTTDRHAHPHTRTHSPGGTP